MSCQLALKFQLVDHITKIWKDLARGLLHETDLSSSHDCLNELIKFAQNTKSERLELQERKRILTRITQRRQIVLNPQLPSSALDSNDIKGLIGEIIAEDYENMNGANPIFIKWKIHGTSKSQGIDIVVSKKNNSSEELILVEAKHVHTINPNVNQAIKKRIEEGIDEFQVEKTLLSLLRIIEKFSESIANSRASGGSSDALEQLCNFLEDKINNRDYRIEVIACADYDDCVKLEFKSTMKKINSTTDIGNPKELVLNVFEIKNLGKISTKIIESI